MNFKITIRRYMAFVLLSGLCIHSNVNGLIFIPSCSEVVGDRIIVPCEIFNDDTSKAALFSACQYYCASSQTREIYVIADCVEIIDCNGNRDEKDLQVMSAPDFYSYIYLPKYENDTRLSAREYLHEYSASLPKAIVYGYIFIQNTRYNCDVLSSIAPSSRLRLKFNIYADHDGKVIQDGVSYSDEMVVGKLLTGTITLRPFVSMIVGMSNPSGGITVRLIYCDSDGMTKFIDSPCDPESDQYRNMRAMLDRDGAHQSFRLDE